MKKAIPWPLVIMLFGSIAAFLVIRELWLFVDNAIWLFSQPLPKDEYPFGILSIPGMFWLTVGTVIIGVVGIKIILRSRRKKA